MRIAGVDIAVKTLSICILEEPTYDANNKLIYQKPIFWKIFNLLDEYPGCCEYNCKLEGKWKNEMGKTFCGRHKRRGKLFKEMEEVQVRDRAKDYTPFEIQQRLVSTLDKYPEIYDIDYMFIENQDQKNGYMCGVASSVFTYYMKKAYIDMGENRRLKEIRYIRATRKTNNVPIIGETYLSTKSSAYLRRKDTSIVYCQRNCKEYFPELLDFFQSHRKKDDLADSLQMALAGIWVLHFDNVYPKITDSIIDKYSKIYGISHINVKNRKKTFKQYVKEFEDKYVWIDLRK